MACVKDMSGKMFIFPQATNTAHVRLEPKQENFKVVTVCHRTFTDLTREHSLFSLNLPKTDNAFLVFLDPAKKQVRVYVQGVEAIYGGMEYLQNKWYSMCTTWDSSTGVVQLWINGQLLTMKYTTEKVICGKPIVTLGQEQDTHGGGFDIKQSFTGMMTDVHMWDYVLSPGEIQKFMRGQNFTPGNVLNWGALECEVKGRVLTGKKQKVCSCYN